MSLLFLPRNLNLFGSDFQAQISVCEVSFFECSYSICENFACLGNKRQKNFLTDFLELDIGFFFSLIIFVQTFFPLFNLPLQFPHVCHSTYVASNFILICSNDHLKEASTAIFNLDLHIGNFL